MQPELPPSEIYRVFPQLLTFGNGLYKVSYALRRKGVIKSMALYDKIEYKRIADIEDGKPFLLLDFAIKKVDTRYGQKDAFDLRLCWASDEEPEWYSGFSAGILSQLRNSSPDDFPTWASLETTEGKKGRSGTRILVPSGEGGEQMALTDDDIPF